MSEAGDTTIIAFVLSDMRSGSTLLDQLLGTHPAILSVGEIHWLAAYATQDRSEFDPEYELVCTCGQAVTECTFWTAVTRRLGKPLEALKLRPAFSAAGKRIAERMPGLFRFPAAQRAFAGPDMVRDSLALADSLAEVSGCRLVVDSSKSEFRFRAIYEARPSRVRAIVLTRDYRAVVHSKMKRGHTLEDAAIGWRGKMWRIAALTDDLPGDTLHRVAYEDLCQDPATVLARVCAFLGVPFSPAMLERPTSGLHHIGGSPSKFDPARTRVVLDSGYQQAFTPTQLARLRRLVGDVPRRWGY